MALTLKPIRQKEAKRFIARHHRHNLPSFGCVFQIGVADDEGKLVGVAMCGLPLSRMLMDGATLEVLRVCTVGDRNANSMLYGACARVAKAMGYARLVTYTLPDESGASLKAAGFVRDSVRKHDPGGWIRNKGKGMRDLFGNLRMPDSAKIRWFRALSADGERTARDNR